MIEPLERIDDLGAEIALRARREGALAILRAQSRSIRRVVVRDGRAEETASASASGLGVQVLADGARTALASRDGLEPAPAIALFGRAIRAARDGDSLGLVAAGIPELPVTVARSIPPGLDAFDGIDLPAVAGRLAELEAEIAATAPGVALRIVYRAELDAWRIFRSDGTDVTFALPRTTLQFLVTAGRHSVAATVAGPRPDLPWDTAAAGVFLRRAAASARHARDLQSAPPHPAGTFPLVIDYTLAKGLAHEAFGHAAEADAFRSSILARDGRFRAGERVGAEHVSIVDEPIPGDHAWQPYGLDGVPRLRATIVDHGRLADALSDSWSAGPGGVRLTGAERAESYRSAPLPRMSNIRIETDAALPAPGSFEDYGPGEVRELLDRAGVLRRHPRVAFLSGYAGGQANTAVGEFVFNCRAIWSISRDGIELRKPAIFSGSMVGALGAIREAFGPLQLDAIGTCGKWGQRVPSSGGSHYFLVLDPDPSFRLGGV